MLLLQFINVCKAPNFQQSVVLSHLLLAIGAAVAKIYSLKCNSKRIICLLERLDGSYISVICIIYYERSVIDSIDKSTES